MDVLRGEKGEGSGSLEGRDGRVARALSLFSNRLNVSLVPSARVYTHVRFNF